MNTKQENHNHNKKSQIMQKIEVIQSALDSIESQQEFNRNSELTIFQLALINRFKGESLTTTEMIHEIMSDLIDLAQNHRKLSEERFQDVNSSWIVSTIDTSHAVEEIYPELIGGLDDKLSEIFFKVIRLMFSDMCSFPKFIDIKAQYHIEEMKQEIEKQKELMSRKVA